MIEDLLVCPVCHHELPIHIIKAVGTGACSQCSYVYRYVDGFFNLIPSPFPDQHIQAKADLWQKLQDNGQISYTLLPETNLSVGEREDARRFREFSQMRGTVLDIGCGPQSVPSYARGYPGRFVGIDPLPGSSDREFAFAYAVGEYLPFRDKTFDHVLFATSIDHFLDAEKVLAETFRVLKPGGVTTIWFGEHVEPVSQNSKPVLIRKLFTALTMLRRFEFEKFFRRLIRQSDPRVEYLNSLNVPSGAYDAFHSFRPEISELRRWLMQARLNIVAEAKPDEQGNIFVKAVRNDA
jgi:ubiquinone/menaquinone biosynthesis C-methylase UbiE/uncharacterized protein YbaR (Trm112 family)